MADGEFVLVNTVGKVTLLQQRKRPVAESDGAEATMAEPTTRPPA